ncbi:restriction endonuclease subunit S [Acinetobacter towneri]|uniref:restriction endonuclease subunit S n=1 Tax=Acinetobacter towneri TaxID=202956 RepID=UPI0029350C0D|nr:restriction endonuclease subunit S [Acinetobacter towneri]WOE29772.1 restriction endonuclease subunit S [Acinetobacter towneri]
MAVNIPANWALTTFGELAYIRNGYAFKSSFFSNVPKENHTIPLVKQSQLVNQEVDLSSAVYLPDDFLEKYNAYKLEKGDILIGMSGSIGKVCHYENDIPSLQNQRTGKISLRSSNSLNNDFFGLFLSSLESTLIEKAKGMGVQNISAKDIEELPFYLPPFAEQQKIVEKVEELFSEIDDGINSLEMAQGLLKSYKLSIIDKALTGKITEEWRKNNLSKNAKKIEEIIKAERLTEYSNLISNWKSEEAIWKANGKKGSKPVKPDPICEYTSFKDPNLPIEWTCINLGFLANKVRNGISKKPDENPTGCKIFRISAARAHKLDLNDFRMISYTDDLSSFLVQKNDLLFTRYNGTRDFVGVSALFESDENYLYPDKLILVRVNLPSINSKFLEFVTNYGVSRKYLKSKIRTTAGQSGISGSDIKVTPIPLCSLEEQEIIVNFIEDNLDKIEQLYQENEKALLKLLNLKKLILSKAFSGELVPQDPNDEPASVLLERIKAEKEEELTKAKANKIPKKSTKRKTKTIKEDEPAQQELI